MVNFDSHLFWVVDPRVFILVIVWILNFFKPTLGCNWQWMLSAALWAGAGWSSSRGRCGLGPSGAPATPWLCAPSRLLLPKVIPSLLLGAAPRKDLPQFLVTSRTKPRLLTVASLRGVHSLAPVLQPTTAFFLSVGTPDQRCTLQLLFSLLRTLFSGCFCSLFRPQLQHCFCTLAFVALSAERGAVSGPVCLTEAHLCQSRWWGRWF